MDGISELAGVLNGRMQEVQKGSPIFIELATMKKNGYIVPDSLQTSMTSDEYLCLEGVDIDSMNDGDRLLIAWAGHETIVIGKVGA